MYVLHFVVLILAVLIIIFAGVSFLKTKLFVIESLYIRIMFLIAGVLLLAVAQLFKEMMQQDAQMNVQVQNIQQTVAQNTLDIKKNAEAISGDGFIERRLQAQENTTNAKARALTQSVSGINSQVSATKGSVSSLQQSLNSMNSSLSSIQTQMVTQSTIAPMQQQMTQFQSQFQSMSTQIASLNTQLTTMKQQQVQTQQELAKAQAQIAQGVVQQKPVVASTTQFAINPTTQFQQETANNYVLIYNAEIIPTQAGTTVDLSSDSVKKKLQSFAQSFCTPYPVASYKDGKGVLIKVNFYNEGQSPKTASTPSKPTVQITSDRVNEGVLKYNVMGS